MKILTGKKHIQITKNKIAKITYCMKTIKNMLPIKYMKNLYDTLIKPHLEYGINLWGGTHDSFLIQLIKQQKKVIRIITNSNYNAPTKNLFTILKIHDLNDLYRLNIGKFMYQVNTESLPTTQNNMYTLNSAIHDHNTRQRNNIFIQHCRTMIKSYQIIVH